MALALDWRAIEEQTLGDPDELGELDIYAAEEQSEFYPFWLSASSSGLTGCRVQLPNRPV